MTIESFPILGIVLAVCSAALLSLGNLFQSRGVTDGAGSATSGHGLSLIVRLLHSKTWLIGTVILGAAMLLQLASLVFAQLIVVQPVGIVALVFAALLTAYSSKKWPARPVIRAILLSVVGVGVFVTVAAMVAKQSAIGSEQLIAILSVLGVIVLAVGVLMIISRNRTVPPILHVFAGGILSGFVATLGKTVILRVQTALKSGFELDAANILSAVCVLAVLIAGSLSIYFVQLAHTDNPPEVVVAGLTVIDPFVAVILGITILGEAAGAPPWAVLVFIAAGALAVYGVFALSKATAPGENGMDPGGPAAPSDSGAAAPAAPPASA